MPATRSMTQYDDQTASFLEKYEGRIDALEKKVSYLESRERIQRNVNELLLRMIDDNEQYSRKQNIILDGLKVMKNDSDESIRKQIITEINRLKLDIKDWEVVRAHRSGRSYVDKMAFGILLLYVVLVAGVVEIHSTNLEWIHIFT